MNKILNLTQHAASLEQLAAGVVDLSPAQRAILSGWLTFDALPSAEVIADVAQTIAQACCGDSIAFGSMAEEFDYAMIGGAPFLMSALENALIERGITPLYAFSVRASTEESMPDGTVRKVNTFKHLGFVQI
jgi:hypothetical protein